MRKGILIFIVWLCALMVQAGPIGRSTALDRARGFMHGKGRSISQATAPAARAPRKSAPQGDVSSYYVFNTDGGRGFVIVSGDDRTVPVLGYSLSGSFNLEDIPENMKAWLQGYADQIEALDDAGVTATAETATDAVEPQPAMSAQPVAPLLTSTWGQNMPYGSIRYGYYVDDAGDTRWAYCATGCVATAMAQVMYYHRWPDAVAAEIPSYVTPTLQWPAPSVPAGTGIDWAGMADSYKYYTSFPTDEEYNAMIAETGYAVADLMYLCGVSVQMDYNYPESGAIGSNVTHALKNYFDYDSNTYTAQRSDYTINQWDELLLEELANKRPIVYCGQSTGGGHCFVVDGYDGESLYHVNWGWDGLCDGYYAISILNPNSTSGTGSSSTSDGYSMLQSAAIGVQPNGQGSPVTPGAGSLQLTTANLTVAGNFVVCDFINFTGETDIFNIAYFAIDSKGSISVPKLLTTPADSRLDNPHQLQLAPGYYQTFSLDISQLNLAAGTYKLYPIGFKGSLTTSDLMAALLSGQLRWNQDYYVLITKGSDGGITIGQHPVTDLEITDADFHSTPVATVTHGFTLTVANRGDEFNGTLYAFSTKDGQNFTSEMKTGVAIPAGGTANVDMYFTPTETGTCYVYISTDQYCANVIGIYEVEVPELSRLSVSAVTVQPEYVVVDREHTITATLTNSGGDYHGSVYVYALQPGGSSCSYVTSSDVAVLQNASTDMSFSFTPVKEGTYRLALGTPSDNEVTLFGSFDVTAHKDPAGGLEVVSVEGCDSAMVNKKMDITAKVDNNGYSDFSDSLYVFIASEADYAEELRTKVLVNKASIPTGGSTELAFSYIPSEAGLHYLWITADEAGDYPITERFPFDVDPEPVFGLQLSSYVLPDNPRIDVGLTIRATISNAGDDYSGTLYVSAAEGDGFPTVIKSVDADIAAGDSIEFEFTVTPTMPATWHFMLMADEHFIGIIEMEVPPVSALLGDIDGNGRLDVTDVTLLSKYISDSNPAGLLIGNADINCDGRINVIDVVELVWLILKQ